jgi:dTMP kinase
MSPLFIAVEGPNGVGKSTAIELAAPMLELQLGVEVHITKEPSSTALGTAIRDLEPSLPPEALGLACAADRFDHLAREVEPALARGSYVISDRYLPSSLVLQRLDGLSLDWIWAMNQGVRRPDLTIFIDDEPERIAERLKARGTRKRFESAESTRRELDLYRETRLLLEEEGWRQHVLDASQLDVTATAEQIARAIISFGSEVR